MADTKTITVHGQEFTVPTPYAEGHTLNENEAKVLNQVRAENIANNFRARIKASLEGADGAESMDAIREAFDAYAESYVFNAPRAAAATLSPLEKMTLKVAKQFLLQKIKGSDFKTLKAFTEAKGQDFVDGKIAEIAENDAIIKMAKKALAEEEKLAAAAADIDLAA